MQNAAVIFDEKLIANIMQSLKKRTIAYFDGEFGISVDDSDLDSFNLFDMTVIIAMTGGVVNLLVAFSFQYDLINALYERVTEGFCIQPDEVEMYREAAAGEVVNTILGHWTIDLQKLDQQGIAMTPPVILDRVNSIRHMKDAILRTQALNTPTGRMNIRLLGKVDKT